MRIVLGKSGWRRPQKIILRAERRKREIRAREGKEGRGEKNVRRLHSPSSLACIQAILAFLARDQQFWKILEGK